MKNAIRMVSVLAFLIFAWYLVADRVTPYTNNARVKAVVVEVVPMVSGYLSSIEVTNGQVVERGQVLARIDPRPFQFQVEQARAALETATQEVGASSAQVAAAQAALGDARAMLENTRAQSQRTFDLERQGISSRAQGDQMRAQLQTSQGRVAGAEADLERARQQLGAAGQDNARIHSAIAALGIAELNLQWTELRAPARGMVADLNVAEGTFAHAGQSVMVFGSFDQIWIEAYMTENNLGNIAIGNPVEIALDSYPGQIFVGTVASITAAASDGSSRPGELPRVPRVSGWMRDPQRFPVRIRMHGFEAGSENAGIRRELNAQADVIVYTGHNGFLNALGAGWIRLMTWLSYAY